MVSTTPQPLYLRKKKARYPSYSRLRGPRGRSGRVGKISHRGGSNSVSSSLTELSLYIVRAVKICGGLKWYSGNVKGRDSLKI